MESDIERLKVLIEDNHQMSTIGCNQSTNDLPFELKWEKLNSSELITAKISISFFVSNRSRHRFLQQIITGF